MIKGFDAERVNGAKVMVVGAGALGNEVLKNLALLNVGNILIVDFDTIEYSNLSRSILYRESDSKKSKKKCEVAAERVREINPNVKVQAINGDIMLDVGLGVFRRMDAVIGCLDNRLARLFINRNCFKLGKPWVDGAIENLAGQMNVYRPGINCYECQLTNIEWSIIQYRLGCPDVAQRNATQGRIPTTPIAASIIGAMQSAEALKIIFDNQKYSLAGHQLDFDVMLSFFSISTIDYVSKPDCISHASMPDIKASPMSSGSTVAETLAWLAEHLNEPEPEIYLHYDVVLSITSVLSEKTHDILLPKPHFSEAIKQRYQASEEDELRISGTGTINKKFPHQDEPLSKLGVPPLHILTIGTAKGISFVELNGDENFLHFQ
ncbi:MAG: ThiF family adenylyltransferase [Saprospiraceae bacterium]|nr:ThiF family adenylyltransferase [Saprospiraceae bacterium]